MQVLLPVNILVTLGGTLTYIGSSANIIALGLIQGVDPTFNPNIFTLGMLGLPVCLACGTFLVLFAPRLIPDYAETSSTAAREKKFCMKFYVGENTSLLGKKVSR